MKMMGALNICTIAEQLQADLIESPAEKPAKIRAGSEVKFIQGFLGDWVTIYQTRKYERWPQELNPYEVFVPTAMK
jgi:hypothetical protein